MVQKTKLLKNFPLPFGIAHWGISLFVVGSAISSLFVHPNHPTSLSVRIHVWIGYGTSLFLICQAALLSLKRYHFVRSHVFPYHLEGWKGIMADLKLLLKRRLPPTGARGGLSGLVEGLGLILITLMAITGLTFHFATLYDGQTLPIMTTTRVIHNFFSGFVWAFVIGHGGMAVIHKLFPGQI